MKRLCLLVLLIVSSSVQAATWTIGQGSTLNFDISFEGAPLQGHFDRFNGHITLDAKQPAVCHFFVTIDLASANTGNLIGNKQIKTTPFFDVGTYQKATYRATRCRWDGRGPIEVLGTLTLRGVKKPVPLKAELFRAGQKVELTVQTHLNRLDFGVGQGQWSSPSIISKNVKLTARLNLVPITG